MTSLVIVIGFKEYDPVSIKQGYDNDKVVYLEEFGENWGGKEGAIVQFKKEELEVAEQYPLSRKKKCRGEQVSRHIFSKMEDDWNSRVKWLNP